MEQIHKYCEEHIKTVSSLARIEEKIDSLDQRINGSLDTIAKHVEEGGRWRTFIVSTAITLVLNIVVFATVWGALTNQVRVNTLRLDKMEMLHLQQKHIEDIK